MKLELDGEMRSDENLQKERSSTVPSLRQVLLAINSASEESAFEITKRRKQHLSRSQSLITSSHSGDKIYLRTPIWG